jgi:hypothetical protein
VQDRPDAAGTAPGDEHPAGVGHPLEHPLEGGGGVDVATVLDGHRAAAGPVGADGVTGEDVPGAGGDEQHRPATERVPGVVQVQHPGAVRRVVGRVHVVVEQRRPGGAGPVVPAATTTLEEHQQPAGVAHARPEREPPPTPTPRPTPRRNPGPAPGDDARASVGCVRSSVRRVRPASGRGAQGGPGGPGPTGVVAHQPGQAGQAGHRGHQPNRERDPAPTPPSPHGPSLGAALPPGNAPNPLRRDSIGGLL